MRKLTVAVVLLSLALWGVVTVASGAPAAKKPAHHAKTSAPAKKPAAKAKAIAWHGYEDGLKLAAKEKKLALVDIMASWCGWCKKMDKEVYTDKSIIALSDHVVFIKVDQDKRPDLKSKFQVQGVPTIVFLRNGKEVSRVIGYEPASQFGAHVRQALAQPVRK